MKNKNIESEINIISGCSLDRDKITRILVMEISSIFLVCLLKCEKKGKKTFTIFPFFIQVFKCKSIWVRILNRGIIDDTINRKINNL